MYRLTATFQIRLQQPLRVKRAEDDPLDYTAGIEGFDVRLVLVRNGGARIGKKGEVHAVRVVTQIHVSVSRDEGSAPPDVPANEKGGRNFTERAPWFGERQRKYSSVVAEAVNRVMSFFKYEINTPHLREVSEHDPEFMNPVWTDGNGAELEPGILEFTSRILPPAGPSLLGEKDFTEGDDAKLRCGLRAKPDIETYREFLSDAQTSILDDKLDRAVLEMAIACEVAVKVAVKAAFSAKDAEAGALYEYLENQRKIGVRVLDLIDGIAKVVFGESFKTDVDPAAYEHVDLLFRARNNVAHRGQAVYRDYGGDEQQVDRQTLEAWWPSVDRLVKWIAKKRPGRPQGHSVGQS